MDISPNENIQLEILFVYWIQRFSPKTPAVFQRSAELVVTLTELTPKDLYPDGRPRWALLWYAESNFLKQVVSKLYHTGDRLIRWEARLYRNRSMLLSKQEIYFRPDALRAADGCPGGS
jgi:hypothetical protein